MANNFRLHLTLGQPYGPGGNVVFVSKAGDDANDGLTPDTPVLTIPRATLVGRDYIIIGAGYYRLTTPYYINNDRYRYFYADGFVIIDALGGTMNGGAAISMTNITVRNLGSMTVNQYGIGGTSARFFGCDIGFVENANGNFFNPDNRIYSVSFDDSIIRNMTFVETSYPYQYFLVNRSILLKSRIESVLSIANTYISTDSFVRINSPTAGVVNAGGGQIDLSGKANINNFNGKIAVGAGAFQTLAQQKAAYPTINAISIDADPLFTNVFAGDYSLTTASPHKTLGIGPATMRQASSILVEGPIGDVSQASGHGFRDAASGLFLPIIDAQNIVCTLQSGQKRLKVKEAVGGPLTGWYETGIHQLGDTAQQIKFVNYLGGNNEDTDYPASENLFNPNAPEPANNNVANAFNYVSGHEGRNPNRKEFQMRWGSKDAPDPLNPNDFFNNGQYLTFEWSRECLYNPISLLGNGSPYFIADAIGADAPRNPQGKYTTYKVTLTNGYFSK